MRSHFLFLMSKDSLSSFKVSAFLMVPSIPKLKAISYPTLLLQCRFPATYSGEFSLSPDQLSSRKVFVMTDALILDAVRTPRGRGKRGKGALTEVHSQELLAQSLNELVRRSGIDPDEVEDGIIGCVTQAEEQGANISMNAALSAG